MAPWKFRGDSDDPVEKRRRELADQQKRLAEQMSQIEAKLEAEKNPPPPPEPSEPAPPVWRLEEEESYTRDIQHPVVPSKRVLRAQRARDFRLFLMLALPLLAIVIWLVHRLLS